MFELVLLTIGLALVFDFYNGMNDAANSIATIVSTRILTPRQAVAWAAFWNFVAAFVFGTAVAKAIHSGILKVEHVSQMLVLAALIGAIAWTAACTRWGLPISVSHSLIGGIIGAGLVSTGFDVHALQLGKIGRIGLFIFLAPVLGLLGGAIFMSLVYRAFRTVLPGRVDRLFRTGQLASAAAYSLGHGANDAQKTMGIITLALGACTKTEDLVLRGGEFHVPYWVVLAAHAAIAVGTLVGGAAVIRTMGTRLTKLRPPQGFCAETSSAIVLFGTAHAGIPVSTTHAVAGAIMGVGAVRRWKAVRWGVAKRIVVAWLLTIPCSALVSGLVYALVNLLGLVRWAEGVR
ncbi:MAG TPA: inorganic phosphate transporter [Planctomycetota bacterium]|nr:inorganic phosphate transporter [Planctomycetota bacterium]